MFRCDDEGVPKIVQSIKYESDSNTFLCYLFDGRFFRISSTELTCYVIPDSLTDKVYLEVEEHVENYYYFIIGRRKIMAKYYAKR